MPSWVVARERSRLRWGGDLRRHYILSALGSTPGALDVDGWSIAALRPEFDDVICLKMPEPFMAIGLHYRDFHQLSDDDVVRTLARARAALPAGRTGSTAA